MAINLGVLVTCLNAVSRVSLPRLPLANMPGSDLVRNPGGIYLSTVH